MNSELIMKVKIVRARRGQKPDILIVVHPAGISKKEADQIIALAHKSLGLTVPKHNHQPNKKL